MKMVDWDYNPFFGVIASATVTTMIASLASVFSLGEHSELAVASSILFLIPGVPLMNAVIDFINGHMGIGIGRAAMGLAMSFCLAVGMLFGMNVMGLSAL